MQNMTKKNNIDQDWVATRLIYESGYLSRFEGPFKIWKYSGKNIWLEK